MWEKKSLIHLCNRDGYEIRFYPRLTLSPDENGCFQSVLPIISLFVKFSTQFSVQLPIWNKSSTQKKKKSHSPPKKRWLKLSTLQYSHLFLSTVCPFDRYILLIYHTSDAYFPYTLSEKACISKLNSKYGMIMTLTFDLCGLEAI